MNLKNLFQYFNGDTKSICDLLPWFEQLSPNLIINRDGSLLSGFVFEGLDLTSSTQDEHDAVCESFQNSLKAFNESNMIWSFLDKRRKKYQKIIDNEDDVANYVISQWNKSIDCGQLSFFENYLYVSFTPYGNQDGYWDEVTSLMKETNRGFFSCLLQVAKEFLFFEKGLAKHKNKILTNVKLFEDQLVKFLDSVHQIKIKRLERNELITALSNRINLASRRSQISITKDDLIYLNSFLVIDSIKRLDGGVINFIGSFKSVFVAALTIKGYPGFINNIDTEKILNVDGSFTLIQVYKFLNPSNAKNLVMKAEQIYRSQIKSPVVQMFEKISGSESNKINKGNLVLADDCQSALIEMTAEEIDFGYHSMSILVVEESLECLSDTQKKISEILINSGYGVIKEVMYQMGAFLTSIPGVMNGIIRSTLISSRNLSNLIILRSVNSGSEINTHLSEQRKIKTPYLCLLPTHTNVPEKFNFHVGDVGHFMVVGPSGSGKTTLMNFLMIHWLQYSPCRVFVIDKDKSCYLTLRALGGSYISLNSGSTGSLSINPLLNYRTSSAQFKLESWIVGIMESRSASNISARELLAIRSALNMLSMSSSVMTLTKLKQMLEGLNSDLASRLSPWVKSDFNFDHSLNHIFDNEKDDFFEAIKDQKNGVIGIDFSGFNNDSGLMAAILEYLFNCIDEVVDGKIPTLIYLEEAWYLLQNDRFRKGFEDWIKTMRKKLAIVGISTQSVNDILNSGISTSLNDNIKTRIYLSNSQINSSRHVYKNILGIDDEYIEIIKGLKPKSEYFICQENKYRIVNLKLTENILAFTRSDRVAIDAFDDFLLSNNLHQYKKYLSNLQRVAYAN